LPSSLQREFGDQSQEEMPIASVTLLIIFVVAGIIGCETALNHLNGPR